MSVVEHDPVDVMTQTCTRCGKTKTGCDFPIRVRWPDGTAKKLSSHCRECKKVSDEDYRRRTRHGGPQRLDIAPLQAFLAKDGRHLEVMADLSGISGRTIWAISHGERSFVELSTADQIITRCGGVFELEYPLEGDSQ